MNTLRSSSLKKGLSLSMGMAGVLEEEPALSTEVESCGSIFYDTIQMMCTVICFNLVTSLVNLCCGSCDGGQCDITFTPD